MATLRQIMEARRKGEREAAKKTARKAAREEKARMRKAERAARLELARAKKRILKEARKKRKKKPVVGGIRFPVPKKGFKPLRGKSLERKDRKIGLF